MAFEVNFSVRLCEPADAATLAPLVLALAQAQGHPAPPELEPLTEVISVLLTSGFSDFLLAEIGDQPVGCLQINYRLSTMATAPYGAIEDFYISPAGRAQGVGTSMIDYACQRADGRGCAYIQTEARPDSRPARRLYERLGFQQQPGETWRRSLPTHADCDTTDQEEYIP